MAWENLEADIADELDGGASDRRQAAIEKWALWTREREAARMRAWAKTPAGRESLRRTRKKVWQATKADAARYAIYEARQARRRAKVMADPAALERRRAVRRAWARAHREKMKEASRRYRARRI